MSGKKIDLTGKTFGKLTVLEYSEEFSKPRYPKWKCQCSCDNHTIIYVKSNSLRTGNTKSCGCLKTEGLVGKAFGRWKVLRFDKSSKITIPKWIVECSCSKHTVKSVTEESLKNGASTSCGCLKNPNLTGKQFGRLTVLKFDEEAYEEGKKQGKKIHKWICECNCKDYDKNIVSVFRSNLVRGTTTSCGCVHSENTHEAKFDNLVGQKFGRLTVIEFDKEKSTTQCSCWICKCECGNEISVQAGNLKSGHTSSCGCLNSYIESVCKLYFNDIKINYITQHTYDDCRYKQPLKFDFYLPDYNYCIEFDGLHHFEPTTFGGRSIERAEKDFEETQIKDEIKNNYCKNNNIKLIRIPYWDFDNYKNILFDKLGIGGETCL